MHDPEILIMSNTHCGLASEKSVLPPLLLDITAVISKLDALELETSMLFTVWALPTSKLKRLSPSMLSSMTSLLMVPVATSSVPGCASRHRRLGSRRPRRGSGRSMRRSISRGPISKPPF